MNDAAASAVEQRFDTEAGYRAAIDQLIGLARRELRIFDRDLRRMALAESGRSATLAAWLAADPLRRLAIVIHDTDPVAREMPRLSELLRRWPGRIEFRQSPEHLRHLADALLLADRSHGVVRFHADQPRGKQLHHAPAELAPYWQRFDDLWELSEPCLSSTVLGL